MKHSCSILFLILLGFTAFSQIGRSAVIKPNAGSQAIYNKVKELPVTFRKNMGQWDERVIYQGFSPGWNANINFLKNGLSFGLRREVAMPKENLQEQGVHKSHFDLQTKSAEHLVWNLYFKGMNPGTSIISDGREDSHVNYLIGNDASKHCLNVPDYRVVTYLNVYSGIDAKYYSTGNNIKYDFMVKPGAEVSQIQMSCEGIERIRVNEKKQLEITNAWGTLIEEMPESYQMINGAKVPVNVEYIALNENTFGFEVKGKYDRSQILIIDPVILAWGTFVGASTTTDEGYCYAVGVDPSGNVYLTGFYEGNFPITPGAYDPTYQFQQDAFACKLTPNAASLIYATYLGGTSGEWGYGITANAAGEAYVVGRSASANFPTTAGSYQPVFAGGNGFDAFVTKLNSIGTAAVYSTFIGGTQDDEGFDIAVNPAGEAFITGVASTGFPVTPGAFQTTINAGYGAMVAKLNAAGTALMYAGILGGNLGNYGYGLDIDAAGNVYVTGETGSWANNPPSYTDFPTTPGAYKTTYGNCGWKGFLTKINPSGSAMVYSTLLGGNGNCPITGPDMGIDVAVNAAGEAFVIGNTGSQDYPTTPGAYDQIYNTGDVFVTCLNAAGSGLIYSTFYGGTMGETACGIAINSSNEAFISGYTETDNGTFPITSCAYQPVFGGQSTATKRGDIFVAKFNASGTTLQFSTFMGGNSDDYQIPKIVLYGACEEEVIVNGTTHSANFPTTAGVFMPTKMNGGQDQPVVFKLRPDVKAHFTYTKPPCSMTVTFADSSYGNCVWQSGAWTPNSWTWYFGDGTTSTQQNPVHTYTAYGTYSVTLVVSCPKDSITIPITISNTSGTAGGSTTLCGGGNAVLTATGGTTYTWNTGATTSSITVAPTVTTNYTVIITSGGCSDTIPLNVTVSAGPVLTNSVTPVTCFGSNNGTSSVSVSGGSAPYTYSWSPSGGTNAMASGLSPGNYTVTVTDASGTCSNTQTLTITQPAPLTATGSSTPDACGGSSGTAGVTAAGGTSGYSYAWNPTSATTSAITGLAAGNYSVTITDANGCTKDTVLNVPATGSITATSTNATICAGQSATLNAGGGTNYSWSTGSTTASVNVSPSVTTTYSVIISSGSCVDTATSTVTVYSTPVISAYSSATIVAGNMVTLSATGGVNYSWSNGASGSDIMVAPLVTTTYCVYSGNANCSDSACVTIYIEPKDCGFDDDQLFVPDAFSPNNDSKNDKLGIYYPDISCIKEINFIIYDRWGEKIFEADDMNVLWDGTYKGSIMNTAVFVYYMKVSFITGKEVVRKGNISLIR